MALDLTLGNTPTFNNSGKYGKSFATGRGLVNNVFVGQLKYTLEAWVKTSSSGSIMVATGSGGCAWLGMVADGRSRASYGNGTGRDLHGPVINDGAWHHLALTVSDVTGGVLYVDGVSAATAAATDAPIAAEFGVRFFGGVGFDWVGEVDEVAVTSGVKYAGNFTPGPVANNQANLIGVWHLEGDGINSAGLAAPVDNTPPTSSSAAVANGSPTIVAITMSEAMDPAFVPAASAFTVGGHAVSSVAISGAVINLTCATAFVNGEAARTLAYVQPGTSQARDVAGNLLANFSGLAITNNVAAAGDTTPPAFVSAQVTNSQPAVILVTMNETLAASVPPNSAFTPSGGRTVTGVTINGTVASIAVSSAYASGDVVTIGYTQPGANPRLQDASGNPTATFAAQPVTNNVSAANNALDTSKMVFSPGNWNLTANSARAINAGAYFRTLFTGTGCKLQFDMTGVTAPSTMYYQIDNGPMTEFTVAANVVLSIPTATAQWADKGGHTLRVITKQRNPGAEVWTNSAVMVALTGIVLDAGKALLLPTDTRALKGIVMGDSITEGQVTLDSTGNGDGTLSYAYALRDLLGAEIGVIGFGGQGWTVSGGGNSPVFSTTYNKIYNGAARSFAGLDFVAINHATNDGGNDVTAAATSVLNGILADATLPGACKIIVMRPFNGAHAAQLQAAIAACSSPARVSYMDTAGFFNTANAYDGLHPWGNESSTHIAPQVATSIRAILAGAPALTQRTFTIRLATGTNPDGTLMYAANLSGLKVSHHDGLPNASGVARYESDTETTDANGYLTYACGCASANGHVTVIGPNGLHYNAAVAAS